MIAVSVIVPVYNVASYLAKALDSLLNQTLDNIEILCIEDKSTDNSLDILHKFAARDKRIKIVENSQNCGVSKTRNRGIDLAEGEYIGFLDADDWVDTDYFEVLYIKAKSSDLDMVKGNIWIVDGKTKKKAFISNVKIREAIAEDKFIGTIYSTYFYNSIYKRNMLQDKIYFNEAITNSEDVLFLLEANIACNSFDAVDDVYYYYLQRDDSASHAWTGKKFKSSLKAFSEQVKILNNSSLSKEQYLDYFTSVTLGDLYGYCYNEVLLQNDFLKHFKLDFLKVQNEIYNK